LTDLDFYTLLKRADSYISAFEKSAETQRIISEGKSAFEDLLNAKKAQERQYNGYGTISEPPQSPVYQTDPNAAYPQQQTYGQAIGEAQWKPSGQGYPQQAQQAINQYYGPPSFGPEQAVQPSSPFENSQRAVQYPYQGQQSYPTT
jgi:hypothetical protein